MKMSPTFVFYSISYAISYVISGLCLGFAFGHILSWIGFGLLFWLAVSTLLELVCRITRGTSIVLNRS